jgi:truncated hemoglobin YjbI
MSGLYGVVGGKETCRQLSVALYARVGKDPLLRPLFPGKSLRCAIEAFAAFLAQFLDGPSEDAQQRWWLSLRESHLRFQIGHKERDAWMKNMIGALDDVPMEDSVRGGLRDFFERSSAYLVNQGQAPRPANGCIHGEISQRWDAQRALDEAIAAIRDGDADRALSLAGGSVLQTRFAENRAIFANFLALMIGGRDSVMLDYVGQELLRDPALTQERGAYGRTLLHAASGAGIVATVELLLRLGADPNATNGGGHTPLYCVGNECGVAGGGSVVRALVHSGANVNARDGVKHCTALHMAARRGNAEVAEALLDCGADIEARDSLGDTPLRRSVNCNKVEVAALLVARGAAVLSIGSKGLTPLLAARTAAMKRTLHGRESR